MRTINNNLTNMPIKQIRSSLITIRKRRHTRHKSTIIRRALHIRHSLFLPINTKRPRNSHLPNLFNSRPAIRHSKSSKHTLRSNRSIHRIMHQTRFHISSLRTNILRNRHRILSSSHRICTLRIRRIPPILRILHTNRNRISRRTRLILSTRTLHKHMSLLRQRTMTALRQLLIFNPSHHSHHHHHTQFKDLFSVFKITYLYHQIFIQHNFNTTRFTYSPLNNKIRSST